MEMPHLPKGSRWGECGMTIKAMYPQEFLYIPSFKPFSDSPVRYGYLPALQGIFRICAAVKIVFRILYDFPNNRCVPAGQGGCVNILLLVKCSFVAVGVPDGDTVG